MNIFTEDMKKWVVLDKQIDDLKKDYQIKLKSLKENKDKIEIKLTTYMKDNNLQTTIINTSEGKIKYTETNIQSPLTYKLLLDSFKEAFNEEEKSNQLLQLIKSKREIKKQISLKRNTT